MLCILVYTDVVRSMLSACNVCIGAGEDVEAVMERLRAQASDNIALRERQAKLEKDQQVTTQLAKKNSTSICLVISLFGGTPFLFFNLYIKKKRCAFQRSQREPPKAAARS